MVEIKNTYKKYSAILLLGFSIIGSSFFAYASLADTTPNTTQSTTNDDTQKQLDELEKKAKIYREIINIKQQQSATLGNQISIMDSSIKQIQSQMENTKQQIDDLNDQIVQIQNQISVKQDTIDTQKQMLANLLQTYYEYNQQDIVEVYLNAGNIGTYMTAKDRVGQTGDKINEIVHALVDLKTSLENQKQDLDSKKTTIIDKHNDLQDQNGDLQATKQQKQTLLVQTQGEESKYQQLLQRIEEQKQELLDVDQLAGNLSADTYDKPAASLFASTDWFYSQRDSRWANNTIGNTKTLMKSYGCAVAAVAMVFKEHGGNDTPGTLANKPLFSGDLINWPASWSNPKLALVSSIAHGASAVNWQTIDKQIAKGHPVIVYIKKTNNKGGHYVVIHHKDSTTGKYAVHDPYFGPNIFLNTSRALVGQMGVNSGTVIDQMIIYN